MLRSKRFPAVHLLGLMVFFGADLSGTSTALCDAHEGHHHGSNQQEQTSQHRLIAAVAGNPAGTFENKVSITERENFRIIVSNGLPSHATGQFPGRRNPNRISPQQYEFRVPLSPSPAPRPTKLKLGKFGVALNGIPIDPGAAEFWRGDFSSPWQYAVINGKIDLGLDMNQAHVQPGGEYHYHGRPIDLVERLSTQSKKDGNSMTLVGYAADGYPIYDCDIVESSGQKRTLSGSYELKKGDRPAGSPGGKYDGTFLADWEFVSGSGDLDEFNGSTGPTPEYPDGTFYYVLTKDFPYVPRMLKGTPDQSFTQRGPGGPRGRGGPPRGPSFGPPRFPPPPRDGGRGFRPPPRRESNESRLK